MSRTCEIMGVKAQTGHSVPVNRSQTGVRTNRTFQPNIQKVSFASDKLGDIRLRVAVKTLRSVEHNGGIDKFLLKTANTKLTPTAIKLKTKIKAALTDEEKAEIYKRKSDRVEPKSKRSLKKEAAKKAAGAA